MSAILQRLVVIACVALGLTAAASAQDLNEKVTIDELRSPTSPAFTILGVAPTNVVRPNTPREFAAELLRAQDKGDGELPSDIAVELAPYWLGEHPKLKFSDYYPADGHKGVGKTIAQSLSVSLASSDIPDDTIDGQTLALGVRFLLAQGRPSPELADKVKSLKNAQLNLLDCVPDITSDPNAPQDSSCTATQMASLQTAVGKLGADVRAAAAKRSGWVVEAAFAESRDYPSATGVSSHPRQFGAWFTGSYSMRDPSGLTLLAVARYFEDQTGSTNVSMVDVGGRLIWKSGHMPISLSLEALHRDMDVKPSSTSVLGVLEYPINSTLGLVVSYGKNVATPTQDASVGATVAVNFGFGKGPSVSLNNLDQ